MPASLDDESETKLADLKGQLLSGITCRLVLFLTLAGSFGGFEATVSAQQDGDGDVESISESEWRRGYHGLSFICESAGLEIVESQADFDRIDDERKLLILLGDMSQLSRSDGRRFERFLRAGGAALISSDLGQALPLESLGIRFSEPNADLNTVVDPRFAYQEMADCPIISRIATNHPTTKDVNVLVTNRPGRMLLSQTSIRGYASSLTGLASLPQMRYQQSRAGSTFAAAIEHSRGTRGVFTADQSMFSNQMLLHGDNSTFAIQIIDWLATNGATDERRTHVLIISDSNIVNPLNPNDLQVLVPPPSPREVIEALRKLPPETLLQFGNEVVEAVEQEGVVNELLLDYETRQLSSRQIRRFVLVTIALIIAAMVTWKLLCGGNTNDRARLSTDAMGEALLFESADVCYERFLAAHELVRAFLADVQPRTLTTNEVGLLHLRVASDGSADRQYQNEAKRIIRELRRFQRVHWNEKRLEKLEQTVARWRGWVRQGILSLP